jgi:uncharacterized protein YecE (DUF72 family)
MKTNYLLGCSGYYYRDWKEKFYNDAPASQWLSEYSKVFNTVELNGTFYKVPTLGSLKKQAEQTPTGFKFSAKASRYVTHILRLKKSKKDNQAFENLLLKGLDTKLENILFQMPPSFHYSEENLDIIKTNITDSPLNVIEFRHISWWNAEVFKFFKSHKYVFCNVDSPTLQPDFINGGNKFYLRLHGTPELFKSNYSDYRLKKILKKIAPGYKTCCIYFNNTSDGKAFKNALTLKKLLKDKFADEK